MAGPAVRSTKIKTGEQRERDSARQIRSENGQHHKERFSPTLVCTLTIAVKAQTAEANRRQEHDGTARSAKGKTPFVLEGLKAS